MSDRYPVITAVQPLAAPRIRVDFGSLGQRDIDISPVLAGRPIPEGVTPQVGEYGATVVWAGTWLEIPGDTLWRLSERQLGNSWPPEEFKAWRKRLGLTQAAAAEELGVTRRAIVHYERGARSISKVVRLACAAVEMQKHRAA